MADIENPAPQDRHPGTEQSSSPGEQPGNSGPPGSAGNRAAEPAGGKGGGTQAGRGPYKKRGAPSGAIPPAVPRGRKITNHGPAAQARRDADARYAARKNGIPIPEAPRETVRADAEGKGYTSPGYARGLVKFHAQAAEITGLAVFKIELQEARELENRFMDVMADRGIVLTSKKANMHMLVLIVLSIYGPILLAVARKFLFAPPPPQHTPLRNDVRGPAGPVNNPNPQPFDFRTVNANGKPESDVQIISDGTQVAGAFSRSPDDPFSINGLGI
jgi:hypothetical protein